MASRTLAAARSASKPENDLAERLVRCQSLVGLPDLVEREDRVDDRTDQLPAPARARPGSANSRVAAIFSSMGRARRVVPTTVSRFRSISERSSGAWCPAEQADQDEPSAHGQGMQVARQGLGARRRSRIDLDPDCRPCAGRRPRRNRPSPSRCRRRARGAGPARAWRPSAKCRRRCSPSRARSGRPPCPRRCRPPGSAPARPGASLPWVIRASCAVMKTSGTAAACDEVEVRPGSARPSARGSRRTRPAPLRRRCRRRDRRP